MLLSLAGQAAAGEAPRRFDFIAAPKGSARGVAVRPGETYAGDHGFEPGHPELFSVRAAPGNYRVTLTLGLPGSATETTVKAEGRRLMLDAVAVRAGQRVTRSFIVNVRDSSLQPLEPTAPGGRAVTLKERERGNQTWDDKLTLEFLGKHPGVAQVTIEPAAVPTVFLLGDSTVTDQWAEPNASWGQMLTAFFKPEVAVSNHADSGETIKSFISAYRLAKVLESARSGDWALIQFGHNDQKENRPQTYLASDTTYPAYLRVLIAEFRRLGVTPVLVTSPERRNWTADNHIRPTLDTYAAAVRAVGAAEHVPVIDLNAASIKIYEALGPQRVNQAFANPDRDGTHHNNYGAWVLARAVAQAIKDDRLPLAAALRDDLPAFDASRPNPPETFRLTPSIMRTERKPDGS